MSTIDTHLHIFVPGLDYPWLASRTVPLGATAHGDWSAIVVEAGAAAPLDELRAMQSLAAQHSWIRGFVAPLGLDGAEDFDVVVGYRAGLDGPPITAPRYPLSLLQGSASYSATLAVLETAGEGSVVLDHCGGGEVGSAAWRVFIAQAARHPHAVIKVSAAPGREVIEQVLEVFGPERSMFGTDWPVTADPEGQAATVLDVLGASSADAAAVMTGTAERVYGVRHG